MSIRVYCRYCGHQLIDTDLVCNQCNAKQNFSNAHRPASRKNYEGVIAFIVCLVFGILGFHRFIYGKVGTGLLMLISAGGFGIWWLIDLVRIGVGHFTDSNGNQLSLIHDHE